MKAGWEARPLEECLERFRVPAKIPRSQFQDSGAYPIISQESDFINGYWDKPTDVCALPRPAIVFGDHTQVLKYVDFNFVVGADGVKVLVPRAFLEPKYLYYFLMANRAPSLGYARHWRHVAELEVVYPRPEEQQRIVAVLDEAFEGLDRARANAEANLQNARELFESYAKSVFQPQRVFENKVETTTIGAICDIQSGAGFPIKYQGSTSGEYPFYKVSDMNLPGNEWELQEANHYISEHVRLELRARLFPEDSIVFPKVGGAIATNKKRVIRATGCVDNNVMGLIPDESKVVPEYIHEWLRAFDIYEFSNKANPPSITQGTVSGWPLRVPSRDEQTQVVATAAALREQTEILQGCFEKRIKDLDDLRQSLLQKAFAGELTRVEAA